MNNIEVGTVVYIRGKRYNPPLVGTVIKIRSGQSPYRVEFKDGRYADYSGDEIADYDRMIYLRRIFAIKGRKKKEKEEKEREEKRRKLLNKDLLGKMLSNKMTKSDIMKIGIVENELIEKAALGVISRVLRVLGGRALKYGKKAGVAGVKVGGKGLKRGPIGIRRYVTRSGKKRKLFKVPFTRGKISRVRRRYLRSKSPTNRFLARHPFASTVGAAYGVKTLRGK